MSVAFACSLSGLLGQLAGDDRGAGLSALVVRVQEQLSDGPVRIELDAGALLANREAPPSEAIAALRLCMESHHLRALQFQSSATARDLVHFAALLAGPIAANGVAFARLWTLHGAWHITVDLDEENHDAIATADAGEDEGVIERIAALIGQGASVSTSSASFQRLVEGGDHAAEVLFGVLIRASTGAERRRYFDVMVRLPCGSAPLASALSHPAWFVVRNAVALLGARGDVGASALVLRVIAHPDARVRRAVAEGLARLPDEGVTGGLIEAVADRVADVRREAWRGFTMADRVPRAAQLNDALQHESDYTVLREVLAVARVHTECANPHALVRCIAHLLTHSNERALACDALELLAARQPRSAIPLIRRLLEDADDDTRTRARAIQLPMQPA